MPFPILFYTICLHRNDEEKRDQSQRAHFTESTYATPVRVER